MVPCGEVLVSEFVGRVEGESKDNVMRQQMQRKDSKGTIAFWLISMKVQLD